MRFIVPRGAIRVACLGAALALLAGETVERAVAEVRAPDQVALNLSEATVPTTRVLAIGHWTSQATSAGVRALLPAEVSATVRLYLDGVIDQWFLQQDHTGVVFLLNATSADQAHELLERLPLGQAGLMEFQLTALGPISPLRLLLPEPSQ